MRKRSKDVVAIKNDSAIQNYANVLSEIADLLESARRTSARTVNTIMTATYWEIGRRIVEFEQSGGKRAQYGKALLKRLSEDWSVGSAEDSPKETWSRCVCFMRAGRFRRRCLRNLRAQSSFHPPQAQEELPTKLTAYSQENNSLSLGHTM
jgi:hypothetical protein